MSNPWRGISTTLVAGSKALSSPFAFRACTWASTSVTRQACSGATTEVAVFAPLGVSTTSFSSIGSVVKHFPTVRLDSSTFLRMDASAGARVSDSGVSSTRVSAAALLLLVACCAAAGLFGAILGLGGGVFIVPLLDQAFGVPFAEARGTGFVIVLATSAAGSIALDRSGLVDARLVVHLALATIVGAIAGSLLGARAPEAPVKLLFAGLCLVAAVRLARRKEEAAAPPEAPPLRWLPGFAGCGVGGVVSGLLGIGGGPVQVPVMSELMGVRLPVAMATSNAIVGITAAASLLVYSGEGLVRADLAAPCALATALGAFAGGRLAPRLRSRPLALVFTGLLVLLAGRMAWTAIARAS